MSRFFFCVIFLASLSLSAMELSPAEAEKVGQAIFKNECSGKKERLVWWNTGEEFASLGIGHFIWYPKNKRGPFEETFPVLLTFFKEQGVEMPEWLRDADGCPWNSREAFLVQVEQRKELQDLLAKTMPLQTTFIGMRFEKTLPQILSSMSEIKRIDSLVNVERLKKTVQGKFALIDYLNFKGSGILETERYQGKGWGLKQVLEEMPADADNPVKAFSEAAQRLLKQRVEKSPARKQEEQWLKGWLVRVQQYSQII